MDELIGRGFAAGWLMHAITALLLVTLVVAVRALWAFRGFARDRSELMARVRGPLLRGDVKAALAACDERPGPVSAVLRAGLARHGSPATEIDRAMEHAGQRELDELERRLPLVAAATSLAPLLGFLGTALGMVAAFGAERSEQALIARGVSSALTTTVWGLTVACVAQIAYSYFTARLATAARSLESAADELLEALEEQKQLLDPTVSGR